MDSNKRRGVALLIVLVLIVMISLGAYTFTDMMTAQERSAIMAGRRIQAQAAVASGVEYVKDYLALTPEDRITAGGHWDNAGYFQEVPVSSDASSTLRFSIISIEQDTFGDPTNIRFGLEDQGGKLNINTLATSDLFKSQGSDADREATGALGGETGVAGALGAAGDASAPNEEQTNSELTGEEVDLAREALMMLPDMTEIIADSILDWIDEDDIPRASGAEADAYEILGYTPPNGPISSLDELLLIPGITPELLYGSDRNHNGMVEDTEQNIAAGVGGSGSMARGWSAYLTVNSKDYLVQLDETIDINGDDLETLFEDLLDAGFDEDIATYIVTYRQNGSYSQPEIPEDAPDDFQLPQVQSISGMQPNFSGGDAKFQSVLDIIGTMTEGSFEGSKDDEKTVVASPYTAESDLATILPTLWSSLTVGETGGTGRVNSNHCPSSVLGGLPGMDEATAQSILFAQDPGESSGDLNYLYPTWPLASGVITLEQMKALLPYVSGSGSIFRAQIVGYSDEPGAYARAEVVIDASGDAPVVLSWRDLTHLGPGFSLETLATQ